MRNQMILWFMKKQTKGNLKTELKMKNIILLVVAVLVVSCTTTKKWISDPESQQKKPTLLSWTIKI